MSKKEIRRAARDAFPKAKTPAARRGTGGAYSKRTRTVAPRSVGGSNAPKAPSIRRSLIMGLFAAVFYFVIIQWVFRFADTSIYSNILVAVLGLFLFAGVNYLSERIRYRRYMSKHGGSSK